MPCSNCKENQTFKVKTNKKDIVLQELKKRGLRITNQRKLILDIILENRCSCCKEIYYKALLKDSSIGIATVYRMLKVLEEIRVLDRDDNFLVLLEGQIILLDEDKITELEDSKPKDWFIALKEWLKQSGYIEEEEISVIIKKSKVRKEDADDRLCCGY